MNKTLRVAREALLIGLTYADESADILMINQAIAAIDSTDAALNAPQESLGAIYISPGISVAHELMRLRDYDESARLQTVQPSSELPTLPALPSPYATITANWGTDNQSDIDGFTADQMRGYALDAVIAALSQPAQPDKQAGQAVVPEGWQLLKNTTFEERSWQEDRKLENGNYYNNCTSCDRTFLGYKRRHTCKVCAAPLPDSTQKEGE